MYSITEEQIKDIATGGGKSKIKQMFPEVFGSKVEVGKWYVPENEKGSIWYVESIGDNGKGQGYGICEGHWERCSFIRIDDGKWGWRLATYKEVEEALIQEAEKRGFIKGAFFKSVASGTEMSVGNFRFRAYNNIFDKKPILYSNSMSVFQGGKWAEIVPKFTTITKSEAENRLQELTGDKFKIADNPVNGLCSSLAPVESSGCCPSE